MYRTLLKLSCILLFFLVVFIEKGLAQESTTYTLDLHPDYLADERGIPVELIGSDENGYYFTYSEGKFGQGDDYLMKYSTDFKPLGTKIPLTSSQDDIEDYTIGIMKLKGKIYHISAEATKERKRLFLKTVDLENFSLSRTQEIVSLEVEGYNMKRSYVSLLFSKDTTSIGLFYATPTHVDENVQYNVIIFDKEFNERSRHSYTFPFTKRHFGIAGGSLIDSTEIILLVGDYRDIPVGDKSKKELNYKYTIQSLKHGQTKTLTRVSNDGKWLHNLSMRVDGDTIGIYGLYSNVNKYNKHGTFYHRLNKTTGDQIAHVLSPFPEVLVQEHLQAPYFERLLKKNIIKYKELPYYVFKRMKVYPDGSVILLAEQTFTVMSNYVTTYCYQNLIALKLASDGNLEWAKMIKKDNSKSSLMVYSQFLFISNEDDIVLVYNGNSKNLNLNDPKRYNAFANNGGEGEAILLAEISSDGTIRQMELASDTETEKYRIRPGLSNWVGEGEILLFSQRPGNVQRQRFMTLKIEGGKQNEEDMSID